MARIVEYMKKMLVDIRSTFLRFALVPVFLATITVLISLQIENTFTEENRRIVERLILAAIAGAFFGTALEFFCERFSKFKATRIYLQGMTVLFSVMYYFLLTTSGEVEFAAAIRLVVICFALFAFYIWIPSFKNTTVFSNNALAHFKACFISMLYSFVLTLGFVAIFFAIDLLLVKLDNNIPAHIANIMGTFFLPIYYLALLPDFNSGEEKMLEKCENASIYPKFLEVLVSYIALPLITVFTGVLTIYLIKIVVTFVWPIGQLGPMILWYSAVGLFLYVLCGKLENRFAMFYRKFFPFALIPLVCLQLFSVFIRINAYGVTESRYYLVVFGIYSVICAAVLIWRKGLKPGVIAILAAIFALVTIIYPIDAFTVSRTSQAQRVEAILIKNQMLLSGEIMAKADIPEKDKLELTNIMNYLHRMGHTSKIDWLPDDYVQYQDFQRIFGFSEAYGAVTPEESGITYYNASIDQKLPMDISGYSAGLRINFYRHQNSADNEKTFSIGGKTYKLSVEYFDASDDIEVSVADSSGNKQNSIMLKAQLAKLVAEQKIDQKSFIGPLDMTIDSENSELKMRVILQNIGFQTDKDKMPSDINGEALVLFGEK